MAHLEQVIQEVVFKSLGAGFNRVGQTLDREEAKRRPPGKIPDRRLPAKAAARNLNGTYGRGPARKG